MPSRVEIPKTFATRADYRECRKLHRDYGTSFYYASRLFPRDVRRRVDAVYGFIRVADEWARCCCADFPSCRRRCCRGQARIRRRNSRRQ